MPTAVFVLAALSMPVTPAIAAQSFDAAVALHTAGKLREALRIYHLVAADRATDPDTAGAALNNACVIRTELGDFRGALTDCREALRLRRAGGDPAAIAESFDNLGLTLQGLGRNEEAERTYRESLDLNRKLGDAEAQVITLGNLGALALARDRYSRAMDLYKAAATLAAHHRGEPWAAEQSEIARINQGVVLEKVGAYREALDLYRSLLGRQEGMEPRRRAALLVNAGVIYRNLGDPVSAVGSFREAIDVYRRLGDTAGLSNAWLNVGIAAHLNLQRPREAEEAFRQALHLAEESGDRTEEIQDLFYLGRLLLAAGRTAEAEAVFGRCLAAAQASGSAEGRWSAREGLGRIWVARGDLQRALRHFEGALDEIERVRSGLGQSGWRAGYFGDKRSVYAATVDVLWQLERRQPGMGYAGQAFQIAQRAQARDLLDTLGPGKRPAAPLAAAALRSRLGADVLLVYFLGEEDLYLWTLRGDGLRMMDLGAKGPLLEMAGRVWRDLSKGRTPPAELLARLSGALLGPAGPLPENGGTLRIAPDGLLRYVPFEILAPPAAGGAPLVERATVAYLPSASALPRERERTAAGDLRLVGFGAPRRPRSSIEMAPVPEPPPLAAAERELAAIGRLLGGRRALFTGERATESAFRAKIARGAEVMHFATHTVVDERPGRGSAILLSPAGGDDGLLFPREIAGINGRCELAVLAACSTALDASGEEDGRALASLTGSFLAAGSSAVVATLWDVGDAATAAFMEQLYDQLGRGLPPAEALRRAKLRMRNDPRWSPPALWAGYVLVGDAGPVAPRRSWRVAAIAILVVLASLLLWLSGRRASRPPA